MLSEFGGHCKKPHINHAQFCGFLGFEFFVVGLFMLQAAKKSFGRGVIPAITFSAHTLPHAHHGQMLAIFPAGILAAPIGMMQ